MSYNINFSGNYRMLEICVEKISKNRAEFDQFKNDNLKLQAVKRLKEMSGCGLKEAKEVIDEFWVNDRIFIIESRKEKLERLAKFPLVEEVLEKIKKLDEFGLKNLLMKFTVDDLLSIDEKLQNE